jgi:hypothetical protein
MSGTSYQPCSELLFEPQVSLSLNTSLLPSVSAADAGTEPRSYTACVGREM